MADLHGKPNVIRGTVVTDGSGVGLAGLVVVALDADRERLGAQVPADEHRPAGERRPAGEPDPWVAALLAALDSAQASDAQQPQRLGSVISSAEGAFALEYDDDLFRDGDAREGADVRPDLVLLVLAPDRPGKHGQGRAVADRLLYCSRPIQFESGRIESFAIRVPEELLAKHEVAVPAAQGNGSMMPAALEAEGLRLAQLNAARRAALVKVVETEEIPRLLLQKQKLDKLLPNLTKRPPGKGSGFAGFSPNFEKVAAATHKGFAQIPWLMNPETARCGRVYLGPKDLAALGLPAAIGPGGETIAFSKVLEYFGYGLGPYRNRNLMTQLEVRQALAALTGTGPAAPGGVDPAADAAAPTPEELRADVLKRLQEQVLGMAREADRADPANDLLRVRRQVDQLEQAAGIGNAAASHDVQVLQVAFEPVWTASFDADLKAKAAALYRATAKEDGASMYKPVWPDLDDIEDVQQLRDLLTDIAAAVPRMQTTTYDFGIGTASMTAPAPPPDMSGVGTLALELSAKLTEPYSFEYFAPGAINYGILQTYRQAWTPVSYQVGRVLDSIPLAPSETRTLRLGVTVKSRRKSNSREFSSLRQTQELTSSSRTEIDVMEKTALALSHQLDFKGGFNVGIGSISTATTFGLNQSQEAQRIHKSFAEVSRKAAQEVRRETEVQLETEVNEESASESTRTLRNANDEMTVTYVLYELERRYRVASHIQAVQPVLLVALPMPAPHDIDDAWLLEHAWVIRAVLIDAAFEEALDILEDKRSQDDAQIALHKAAYDAAHAVRMKADSEFERLSQLAATRREDVIGLATGEKIVGMQQPDTGERIAAAILSGGLSELMGGGQSNQDDILRVQREAAQKQLEYLEKELAASAETRDQAAATLTEAADRYSAALTAKAMADQKLLQLRLHVRGNIFYYLHEIWKRRDHDDLFFSLYDLEVPFLEPLKHQCKLRPPTPEEIEDEVPGVVIDGQLLMVEIIPAYQVPAQADMPKKRLVEVADLDRPLGFKGNYVIFPLKTSSMITDFMTVGFLDGYYGVRDPALNSAYSTAELLAYARSAWNDPSTALTNAQRKKLAELITRSALRNPGYDMEVVLPTGKVWMEALKGGQALLEPFKLAHRGMDVLKVEEEVRRERIENLRRLQRIGLQEPKLGDPDIDRLTVVRGLGEGVVLNPDA